LRVDRALGSVGENLARQKVLFCRTQIQPLAAKSLSSATMTIRKRKMTMSKRSPFKVLRAVDPTVLGVGAMKKLEVSSEPVKQDFQPNAKGGLRLVNSDEIRMLARDSATAAMNAAKALGKGNAAGSPTAKV